MARHVRLSEGSMETSLIRTLEVTSHLKNIQNIGLVFSFIRYHSSIYGSEKTTICVA